MKSQKIVSRRKTLHVSRAVRFEPRFAAPIELDESDEPDLVSEDGDAVPEPIEEWADDDDANRWLHEHRFDGGGHYDIN